MARVHHIPDKPRFGHGTTSHFIFFPDEYSVCLRSDGQPPKKSVSPARGTLGETNQIQPNPKIHPPFDQFPGPQRAPVPDVGLDDLEMGIGDDIGSQAPIGIEGGAQRMGTH